MNDRKLLRDFVSHNSQTAFGKLVERYIAMVYWTCRRDVHNTTLAEDATQTVFILLAQKASVLPSGVSISGWLFRTARLVSQNTLRCETRRRKYEEEAAILNTEQQRPERDTGWEQVEPWINDALSALSESDREVVLLRYFDDLSPQELAVQLGTTEATARKRVSRAIERLRQFLTRQGVPITGIALAVLLTQYPARTAPLSAATITQQALQQAGTPAIPATSSPHIPLIHKGIVIIMESSTRKAVVMATCVLLLAASAGLLLFVWKPGKANDRRAPTNSIILADKSPDTGKSTGESAGTDVTSIRSDRTR